LNDNYIQYGCGHFAPTSWRNFDASPTLRFERIPLIGKMYSKNTARFPVNVRYGDIVRGLPLEHNSCDAVYCSHILEHLSLEDLRVALINTRLILKPGSPFRFVVPDLNFFAQEYVRNNTSNAAHKFMADTYLGVKARDRGIKGFVKLWLGNSQHLWMWDYLSLVEELNLAGFKKIRRATYNDSVHRCFKVVEMEERWKNCLGLECVK